jgi:hypothetical protein
MRNYVVDIPGGTATTTVQMTNSGSLKQIAGSVVSAAAGTYEVSLSSTSQIGTAAPDTSVIARFRISATAGPAANFLLPIQGVALKILQNVYIHCTGAGNVGQIMLLV